MEVLTMANDPGTMKAGEKMTAKAHKRLTRYMPERVAAHVPMEIQPKSDAKHGQWFCCTCGEPLQHNMAAQLHTKSHKLGWWTGEHVEQP
jgi:hypothetical protein